MANNTISLRNQRLLDPGAFAQSAPYLNKGLTYKSDDINIHPRDEAGNIVLQENSENNPLLIIEPVVKNTLNRSVLRVIDTAFQYYKFPVSTKTAPTPDLDVDIDLQLNDPIYARYKPSENRRILSGTVFSGILIDELEEGQSQKNLNTYYITKEVKNSGVDLRFRININHRYDAPEVTSTRSTVAFTIIKSGPNYPLNRTYLGQFSRSGADGRWSVIKPYEVWDTFIEVVIPNSEFDIGDNFGIGANSGVNNDNFYHTITADQTYWVITDASKNVDEWNQPIE